MDFVRSHFGKMQLCIVEHFFLYKKVPVALLSLQKGTFSTIQVPFCEEKSVQLVRVAFFRSDFLQNPYYSLPLGKR